jgi:Flp pilus assembly CpaE family ATPase
MPLPVLRVLLIEDNPGDAELVKETLGHTGDVVFEVDCAEALLPGLDRLGRGGIDLVLLDLSLPDSHGLDGLNAVHTHAPSVPVVLLTGLDSESLALRAMQSGAQDYIVKGTLLGPALARTLQHAVVRQRIKANSPSAEPSQAKVLGFMGVKGGVGNTSIACHLAMELKRQAEGRVLLMDLDLMGNAAEFLMNARAPYGISDAADDILHLDADRWQKLAVTGAGGVDVIQAGGPSCREEMQPKAERIRFVVRFVRSLYQWIVVDLGRLSPFSARLAEEVSHLYMVSTCDILGLNEAKSAAGALVRAGLDVGLMALILNQTPSPATFSKSELEKLIGVRVDAMLPDCRKDFEDSFLDGKRLGESRKFHKHVAQMAARIAGIEGEIQPPKTRFSFLPGALRSEITGI